ncbi:MAG: trypsin-like serine protease, partial [Pseudomonadota bacterium]
MINFSEPQARVSVPSADPFDPTYVVSPTAGFEAVVGVFNEFSRGTGVIIGDGDWVLTAAHVIFGEDPDNMRIVIDLPEGRFDVGVTEVIIHPDYSPDFTGYSSANDIALIRLAEDVEIQGYDIYRGNNELNETFQLVGYGIAGNGLNGQVALQDDPGSGLTKRAGFNTYDLVDGTVLPGDLGQFNDVFGDVTPDGSLLFYDFDSGAAVNDAFGTLGLVDLGLGIQEVNSTQGDSGGPTFINGQVAGLVSGGSRFIGENSPDIDEQINSSFGEISFDTRVSFFQDWIDGIVGDIFGPNPIPDPTPDPIPDPTPDPTPDPIPD